MTTTIAVTLLLSASMTLARADATLDAVGGAIHTTSIEGTRATDRVRAADGKVATYEVLSQSLPIRALAHSTAGATVHAGAGGSAPLTTALFKLGVSDGTSNTIFFRDTRTGAISRPSAVRTIALDPADAGAELLDAGHVALPGGGVRAWAFVRRSSGEGLLVDYDVAGGTVRRTPLGFTPPIGSNKGSLTALPSGEVWAVFSTPTAAVTMTFHDLLVSSVVAPQAKGTLVVGAGFDPESTRVGIIAVLIGLFAQPTPAISYQRGDELVVAVPDAGGFRTVARQTVPPGARGLIEDEGLFSYLYLLPYIEQENLYRGVIGQAAEPIATAAH